MEGAEYILAERTQLLRKVESELKESTDREQALAKQLRRQKARVPVSALAVSLTMPEYPEAARRRKRSVFRQVRKCVCMPCSE